MSRSVSRQKFLFISRGTKNKPYQTCHDASSPTSHESFKKLRHLLDIQHLSVTAMTAIVVPNQLPTPRPDHKRYTKRPTTKLGVFLWRWRVWFEATFALTVMEPWEQSVARQYGSLSFVSLVDTMVLFSRRVTTLRCARAFFHHARSTPA
jgi:hypothetical protein